MRVSRSPGIPLQNYNLQLTTLLLLLALAACQSDRPSPNVEATAKWNGARASVLFSLGQQQLETGNLDAAAASADQAVALDPKSVRVRVLIARIALERNQLEVAERELDVARALSPADAEPDYLSGVVYQRWQRPEQAYSFYASAADKAPADLAYLMAKAETLAALGRTDAAIGCLRDKADYFEHSGALRDALGQLYMQAGRNDEATEMLRQASILSADDSGVKEHLAVALCVAGRPGEAAPILRALLADSGYAGRGDLWAALGDCELAAHDARSARGSYQKAVELDGASARIWLGLARAALEAGDLARADLAARKALSIDPSAVGGRLLLGYVQLRQDRPSEALASFEAASSLAPTDPTAACMVGYVLQRGGHADAAMAWYAKALQLSPKNELANRLMAGIE